MASEEKIRNRIEELVGEEHQLWEAKSRGEADYDAARVRPPETIERYDQ
jgi:hypothetical protein